MTTIKTYFFLKSDLRIKAPKLIGEHLGLDSTRVEKELEPILDSVNDNIVFLVEFPYVERFYRDTYYTFFSKKHYPYCRDSVRVSLFTDDFKESNLLKPEPKFFQNNFLGYITFRPTTKRLIGHSIVSPKAFRENKFVCCLVEKEVSICGVKATICAFPFCGQDGESITCAEASIINLCDYFGSNYSEYSTILPSQVTRILSKHSSQRQLPTVGLPTENISYVLKKLGFATVVYSTDEDKEQQSKFIFKGIKNSIHKKKPKPNGFYSFSEFKDLLYIYVESGIPIIATLSTEQRHHHAVIVIGREDIQSDIFFNFEKKNLFQTFSSGFKKVLIMNDNRTPYGLVDFDQPIFHAETNEYYKFRSFIVPLYSKVHLEAFQFKKIFYKFIHSFENAKRNILFHKSNTNYIHRFYLTSSKSYKDYIISLSNVSPEFKVFVTDIAMPRFVWIGEVIESKHVSASQLVSGIIVVDATESGLDGNLIFATNSKCLIFRNFQLTDIDNSAYISNKCFRVLQFDNLQFNAYSNNLKGRHTLWKK